MVSFFIGFGFSIEYLNQTILLQRILGGLLVRIDDCRSGTPGSNLPRHIDFFSFKIEETCTLGTFVEQKLSLCVKKVRNFM